MSQPTDLTRWNRAGLSRFRYVDGNAVEYLELLRKQLVDKFKEPESGLCDWLNPAQETPDNELEAGVESLAERQQRLSRRKQRLLEIYHQDRRDWAWEISRTFARASHITTEYFDAYANERFLGTATQWDNVRKLVEILDYHPAPPASAFTPLVFIAKEKTTSLSRTGVVDKGFQLSYTPDKGDKVIFETLEDLLIDPELNELRPKGWDQSQDTLGNTPIIHQKQYSKVANWPAINLQGVGDVWSKKLNDLIAGNEFKIKDFDQRAISSMAGLGISNIVLREFRAKAMDIIEFTLQAEWTVLENTLLSDIVAKTVNQLRGLTDKSEQGVKDLQQSIEMIAADLDQPAFRTAELKDLLTPVSESESVSTTLHWMQNSKPEVMAGQVGLLINANTNLAEAVLMNGVEELNLEGVTTAQKIFDIDLIAYPDQNTWSDWSKGVTVLNYASRLHKKCWLNGSDVIHTKEAHGFSAGEFIGWGEPGDWKFTEILEVDKKSLRLKVNDEFPSPDTKLFILRPIQEPIMSADYEAVVLITENGNDESPEVKSVKPGIAELPALPAGLPDPLFTLKELPDSDIGGGLLPPASLPKIGSFLFPSPFLPMDLVKAAVELLLSLGVMQIPSSEEFVIKGLPLSGLPEGPEESMLEQGAESLVAMLNGLTNDGDAMVVWDEVYFDDDDDDEKKKKALMDILKSILDRAGDDSVLFKEITDIKENADNATIGPLLAIQKNPIVKAIVDKIDEIYVFDGKPDTLEIGGWVVAEYKENYQALKISAISEFMASDKTEYFSLNFKDQDDIAQNLISILADYRGELLIKGADVNTTAVENDIELEKVPESLVPGRSVLLTCGADHAISAKIESINGNLIKTNPSVTGCSKGELIIRGNVVIAGHGKSKPAKILGSGDATKSNQEFIVAVAGISFTPDVTKNSGVAAAIDVEVAGRIWQQVSTLKDSAPDDHHYSIRMTEDGFIKILFGDGEYGRRLPSGNNNIRVSYRTGAGLSGNVPVHALEKPVNPHPMVDKVQQLQAASGGGDMEDITSLRTNAPSTLLTLERAVSVQDFSFLAASQSSIWQAKAYSDILHGGKMESVKVVILPAGGEHSVAIQNTLVNYLQKHAVSGVQVQVVPCVKDRFRLTVTVRINTEAFIAHQVEQAVHFALIDYFTLKNRKLGEHLYLSEVYKVVESVLGVENSICILNGDSSLQIIRAGRSSVIYLYNETDLTPEELNITVEEFTP